MLPSQLWLLLDTAVLPGLALAHWSTQGWPQAHVSGSSAPFPPGSSGSCSLHGSSVSVCTSSPKGCCVTAPGWEAGVFSLGCILLSPECLDEARLFLGLSQRGSGLHSPFTCWAQETQRQCGKCSAVLWSQEGCKLSWQFLWAITKTEGWKAASSLAQHLREGCSQQLAGSGPPQAMSKLQGISMQSSCSLSLAHCFLRTLG